MPETTMTDAERIPTNLRMLLIMEIVGESTEPLTSAEIGRRIGLPKQTIHRLCNTLIAEGFLAPDPAQKGLRPGLRGRKMAAGVLTSSRDHMARHQIMIAVSRSAGETANFVIPEDEGMSYRDRVETDWAFRVQLPVGTHVPFHCTASGKTFLASLPPAARKKTLASLNFEQRTPHTITDIARMEGELDRIAEQGYALDESEFVEGMNAIAVPVRDPNGRFYAALAVHGPDQRLTMQAAMAHHPMLIEASKRISTALFG